LIHSFVTHHSEDGVDLRYVQELLKHKNFKIMEIYTHITQRYFGQIKSYIDLEKQFKNTLIKSFQLFYLM